MKRRRNLLVAVFWCFDIKATSPKILIPLKTLQMRDVCFFASTFELLFSFFVLSLLFFFYISITIKCCLWNIHCYNSLRMDISSVLIYYNLCVFCTLLSSPILRSVARSYQNFLVEQSNPWGEWKQWIACCISLMSTLQRGCWLWSR